MLFNGILKAAIFDYEIPIAARAQDTQVAKEQAISKGRFLALKYVIKKIVTLKFSQKVDNLITENNAYLFDKSFRIYNENLASRSYAATAMFYFNQKEIYDFLDANKIPYVKNAEQRYLIISNYYEDGQLLNDHPWNDYWINLEEDTFLSNFIFYKPQDEQLLLKKEILNQLKNNLEIDNVFLVSVNFRPDNTYEIKIKNYNLDEEKTLPIAADVLEARSITAQYIEDKLKTNIIASYLAKEHKDLFTVSTVDFNEWVQIQAQLKTLKEITGVEVKEIGFNYVKVQISYSRPLEVLVSILAKNCIFLETTSNDLIKINDCPR